MSGGGMNYLYSNAHEDPGVLVCRENLDYLAECVEIVNKARDDGRIGEVRASVFEGQVKKLRAMAEELKRFSESWGEVLHACERYSDGDWGLGQVADAAKKAEVK